MIIAIDGPAASGKGTLARRLAAHYGLPHLDTGLLYRAVAAMPEVRAALIEAQRNFARRPGGAVLDGRDIGTVICPEAEVKIYVTASPETRAQRRALELAGRGERADYAAILAEIVKRDARDSGRADAPLRAAPDAVRLDTTKMSVEAAFAESLRIVESRLSPLPKGEGQG